MSRKTGKTYWFDLVVPELTDALAFYEGLFGWKFVKLKGAEKADYYMIQLDNELIGGIRENPNYTPSNSSENSSPILYFTVNELQPAMNRINELGGKLIGHRIDLGEDRGCYQWFQDRANNTVAIWAPK